MPCLTVNIALGRPWHVDSIIIQLSDLDIFDTVDVVYSAAYSVYLKLMFFSLMHVAMVSIAT